MNNRTKHEIDNNIQPNYDIW